MGSEERKLRLSATTIADRVLPAKLAGMAKPWVDRLDAILTDKSVNGHAQRMSMIAFAIRLVSAAIAFLSQILLARWIGDFQYGIFVLVWSTAVIVGNLSCFGLHTTIIRFVPEYFANAKHDDLRGLLLTGRVFAICSATLIAGVGALGIHVFSSAIENYYVIPFLLGMLILPMIALGDTLDGTARANSWPVRALSPTYIIRPILILSVMLIALLLGYDANAKTAILSAIIATYATTIFQLVSVTNRVERKLPDGPKKIKLQQWFKVSLPIFLVEGFLYLLTNADVLVVGFFMDPQHVAVYFATVKILALVHFVYFAVKAGVAQRYSELIHSSNPADLAAFARDAASWTFWPALFMACVVILLGKPLLSLFGPSFVEGYPLLFVLLAGIIARSSVGPAESLLNMSGNEKICAALYAATLCFSLSLAFTLIPHFGLWGAAIAFASGMAFEALLLGITVKRRLGFHISIFAGRARPSANEA